MAYDEVVYEGKPYSDFSSSTIQEFQYIIDTRILEVEFKSGSSYLYYGVPPEIVEEWCGASSKGEYHAQNIKWSYRFRKR